MKVAIVGGGAAGCFCAIQLKRRLPETEVVVFEAGKTTLAKVAITGGGRCNLTNSFAGVRSLDKVYPRGTTLMKRALKVFSNEDVMRWFEAEGVALVTQEDCCVFPASQDAMQIVRTLQGLMRRLGVIVRTSSAVTSVKALLEDFDKVVIATGGFTRGVASMLDGLDLEIEKPIPALFTLNIKDDQLNSMMGAVVEDAAVSLCGNKGANGNKAAKMRGEGPLLLTHWGISGPAVLKLSSYAARILADCQYQADIAISWLGNYNEDQVRSLLSEIASANPQKAVVNAYPEELTSRLWAYLVRRAGISDEKWGSIPKKSFNRLVSVLCADVHHVDGRGHYKDEFVTCGGVALSNVNISTLEAKNIPGLYFAGEVLDVDAITGGFNLQAAWSMGQIVANSI
ncbi:MAG: aminoacetone oxidase family FAD-binding enzyme [Bacteroidales bacterium]|nr:aminoacetone oxidase family FAD-binding enzyme [Bacteroidales bacterium]